MAELNEVETHEMTEAEVERIHAKGSPHQHLDPNPHTSDIAGDYTALQVKQTVDAAKKKRDEIREEVGEKLKEALPKRVIPRYLRRALWSKDRLKLQKAIKRAKTEGWTNEEMTRQVRLISEYNEQSNE